MPVNQDWPSVWPAAASFKPSVVPLPVRQGFYEKRGSPPAKHANLELMKIPNFLHLTPPAIERHCKVNQGDLLIIRKCNQNQLIFLGKLPVQVFDIMDNKTADKGQSGQ